MATARPKTLFEELIEAVMEISRVTLPFLAARGDGSSNNMMLIVLMPLLMLIIRRVQTTVYTKIKPKTLIIHEKHKNDITIIYKTVKNYLLNNYAEKFDLTCGYDYSIGGDDNDNTIDMEARNIEDSNIPTGIYSINHRGNNIDLEVSTDKSERNDIFYNTFKLSHRSKAILIDFVKDARLDEKRRLKPVADKPRVWMKIYTWSCNQWVSTLVKIIKKRENLFLNLELDRALFDDIDKFLATEQLYLDRGQAWKRGYLFYGTPGCGKTSTALAIAHYTGRTIYRIKLNQIISSSEFDKACRPVDHNSIVILEELDTIALARSLRTLTTDPARLHQLAVEYINITKVITVDDMTQVYKDFVDLATGVKDKKTDDTQWHGMLYWSNDKYSTIGEYDGTFSKLMLDHLEKTYPSLAVKYSDEVKSNGDSKITGTLTLGDILTALDANDCFYGCLVIITTNHPDRLDPALKRPGRVDMECNFKPADAAVIRAIYESYLRRSVPFVIPADATIPQARLIHQYILTHEKNPAVLDAMLTEYFTNSGTIESTTTNITPLIKSNSTTASPIIPRSLAASFDLLNDTESLL